MSFNVTKSDGTIFATIADQTINTASSLALAGIIQMGLRKLLQNNFIKLTKFSSGSCSIKSNYRGKSGIIKHLVNCQFIMEAHGLLLLSALTSTTIIPNTSNDGTPVTTAFVHSLSCNIIEGLHLPLVNGNAAIGTSIKICA